MDEQWKAGWLVGLTDGEGSFILRTSRRGVTKNSEKSFRSVEFSFRLGLRCDDWQTLEKVSGILGGMGRPNIGNTKAAWLESGKRAPLDALVVNDQENLAKIVDFFTANPLQSKKARDFAIWAEAFKQYTGAIRLRRQENNGRSFRRIPEALFERMECFQQAIFEVRTFKLPDEETRRKWATSSVSVARKKGFEKWCEQNPARPCACGCGMMVTPMRVHYSSRRVLPKFLRGHFWKVKENSDKKRKRLTEGL